MSAPQRAPIVDPETETGLINPAWLNYFTGLEGSIVIAGASGPVSQAEAVATLVTEVADLEARLVELTPGGGRVVPLSVTNKEVADFAEIEYRKLKLTGKIVDADIHDVAWPKLTGVPVPLVSLGALADAAGSLTNDGAGVLSWGAGSGGGQQVHTETGAVATGTTQIPFDDTIPQNTEGTEFLTLAITPTDATHKLKIEVVVFATVTTTPWLIAALFQDSVADAIAVGPPLFPNLSTTGGPLIITHHMVAGTTSAITFKVRIGPSNAATVTFNGQSAGRKFGGALASSITITEYT